MWRDSLPDQCPPKDAGALDEQHLIRLVGSQEVTEQDFDSHAALGYACTFDGGDCDWASCSLFLPSYPKHKLKELTKLKRLKSKTHVAFVKVDESSGIAKVKATKHVDLWFYSGCEPSKNVGKVVSVDDYEPA